MPCDTAWRQERARLRAEEAERRQRERDRKRKRELAQIEQALASGQARIVNAGGRPRLVGVPLPNEMKDVCVLAALQQRGSVAFKQAIAKANTQTNFVAQHNAMHNRGGGHGH